MVWVFGGLTMLAAPLNGTYLMVPCQEGAGTDWGLFYPLGQHWGR